MCKHSDQIDDFELRFEQVRLATRAFFTGPYAELNIETVLAEVDFDTLSEANLGYMALLKMSIRLNIDVYELHEKLVLREVDIDEDSRTELIKRCEDIMDVVKIFAPSLKMIGAGINALTAEAM